jgi:hypothetical protein
VRESCPGGPGHDPTYCLYTFDGIIMINDNDLKERSRDVYNYNYISENPSFVFRFSLLHLVPTVEK